MPSRRTFSTAVLFAVCWSLSTSAPAQEASRFRYLSTNFSLTDVNVGKLLDRIARVGVTIPFDLEGAVSASLRIQVPINALRQARAYRFDGSIASPRLKVANLELLNVHMEVAYRDGVLDLSPLTFRIPDAGPDGLAPGRFRGTGRMELVPRGELTLNLALDGVPARSLSGIISQPPPLTGGRLVGQVGARVPAGDVRKVSAWNVNGRFSGSGLKAIDRELRSASFQFTLENGELNIRDLTAAMEGASLAGTARANLSGDTSYTADLKLTVSELGKVVPGTGGIQPADPLLATARVSGTLRPLTYQVGGEATVPETTVGRLAVDSGRLDYSVTRDEFAIRNLDLKLYRGAITGNAHLPREGEAMGALDLQLSPALDLKRLAEDLGGKNLPLVGQVAGTVTARVPRRKLGDLSAWRASLDLSIREGTAWGLSVQQAAINGTMQEGIVKLSDTRLNWANSTMDVSGQLELKEPQKFNAQVKLLAGDLKDLNRLSGDSRFDVPMAGRIEANANVKGQLDEFEWQAEGTVQSRQLSIDKVLVDLATADVSATPEMLTFEKFELDLYGGKATGKGQYPLMPDGRGEFQLDWDKINVGSLLQAYLETDTPVTGLLEGNAKASLGPEPEQGERQWTAQGNFTIPTVTIGTVESANFRGGVEYENERLEYSIRGKLFDGDFQLQGEYPSDDPDPPTKETLPGQGQIELENLNLQQVWRAFTGDPAATNLAGTVDLDFHWSSADRDTPDAFGSVVFSDLVWNGRPLTERLAGDVAFRGNRLVARGIRGTVLDAQLEAEAVWGVRGNRARLLLVRLRHISVPVIAELTPFPEGIVEGYCDLEARIVPGPLWKMDVRARATRLLVWGVELHSVSLPFRGSVLPSFDRGEFTFQSGGASLSGGRLKGQVSFRWGDRRQVRGELTFARVDTQSLVQQSLGSDLPGDGHLSGTIRLEGTNLRFWSDTTVSIDAKLSRFQPRRLPVVEALQSVVKNISFSQPADEGRIRATYAKGAWSFKNTTLSGPMLEMLIEGTVAANRRLNLDIIVRTGRKSIDRRLTHLAGGQLGDRLWALLADRLILVHVTGTIDRPVVNIKPLSLLNVKAKQ